MRYLRKTATFFLAAVILLTAAVPARAAAPEWQRKTTAIGRTDHAFVDHLNVLIADEHIKLLLSNEHFFLCNVVLKHCNESFAGKLVMA